MSLRKSSLPLLALSLALTALPSEAKAAFETFSANYGSAASPLTVPFSTNLVLNQFDTTLGTLTGISFTLTLNTNLTSKVFNNDAPNTVDYLNVTASTTVTTSGAGLALSTAAGIGSFSGSSSSSVIVAGTGSANNSGSTSVSMANFGSYEGVGTGTYAILASAMNSAGGSSDQPNTSFGANATSYGMLSVTYTYTPTIVPEPASAVMLGLGLVAVGGFAVRRRSAR